MSRTTRFFSGALFAAVLTAGAMAFAPATVNAAPILGCSGGTCCTFDNQTGQIYDCRPAS